MNLKIALYFLLVFQNHKLNNTSGKDERFLDASENLTDIQQMYDLNYKKKLLDILKSKHISIFKKMDKINENNNNKLRNSLINGGFFDDW